MARLGDICVINPKSPIFEDDFTVSFVPMQKVGQNGEFDASDMKEYSEVKKGFTYFQNGDVLFAKITPCMENGKGAIARNLQNGIGFGSTEFHVLRPKNSSVLSEWVYYLLSWSNFRKEAENNMTGSAGQKRVPKSFLENYDVIPPPLEKQEKQIISLAKIDDVITLRKQQLSKLDEIVKARFIELFGDPVANEKGWDTKPLLEMGSCKNGMNFHYEDSGVEINCLGVGDFKDYSIISDTSILPTVSLNEMPSSDYMLQDDDIVFVRSNGNKALVGRSVAVYPGKVPTTFSGFCIRYRKTDETVNIPYLLRVLKAESVRQKMAGRGANIQNLNQQILGTLIIPVPPIDLQNQFAAFVEQTDKSKSAIQQSLDKLETLKGALMQKYFG